ncbi:hypothetical protein K0J45_03250 [Shewanella alkalitolerans]|uniref:hypothetical protein n=1 Tax=Shewanella alkalitolerans TaxID=2864209 RepID=UPI001C65A84E|nr:hypothetical protein [Shewanella alkalitolerans]QYJ98271.1 hypothetical protein K0J45_03250 [Shewanella alkalitolerans]
MRLAASLITISSIMLVCASVHALERFAGIEDGSDANLKAVCKDYMVNSYLKNDPELFFHLLPKSMVSRTERLEKKWYEGHLKRFGSEPLSKYDIFEMEDEFRDSFYKGHAIKSISIKYKAGIMKRYKGSSCSFEQFEDKRWYFAQKP